MDIAEAKLNASGRGSADAEILLFILSERFWLEEGGRLLGGFNGLKGCFFTALNGGNPSGTGSISKGEVLLATFVGAGAVDFAVGDFFGANKDLLGVEDAFGGKGGLVFCGC